MPFISFLLTYKYCEHSFTASFLSFSDADRRLGETQKASIITFFIYFSADNFCRLRNEMGTLRTQINQLPLGNMKQSCWRERLRQPWNPRSRAPWGTKCLIGTGITALPSKGAPMSSLWSFLRESWLEAVVRLTVSFFSYLHQLSAYAVSFLCPQDRDY